MSELMKCCGDPKVVKITVRELSNSHATVVSGFPIQPWEQPATLGVAVGRGSTCSANLWREQHAAHASAFRFVYEDGAILDVVGSKLGDLTSP